MDQIDHIDAIYFVLIFESTKERTNERNQQTLKNRENQFRVGVITISKDYSEWPSSAVCLLVITHDPEKNVKNPKAEKNQKERKRTKKNQLPKLRDTSTLQNKEITFSREARF